MFFLCALFPSLFKRKRRQKERSQKGKESCSYVNFGYCSSLTSFSSPSSSEEDKRRKRKFS